jgi:hypothetical protein
MTETFQDCRWFALSTAAKYLDVSEDTINRRGIPWQDSPSPGKLRWKQLKLGEGTRMERRYLRENLDALLVSRMNSRRMNTQLQ